MKNNYSLNYYFLLKWLYAAFAAFFIIVFTSYFLFFNASFLGEAPNFYFGLAFFTVIISHDLLKNRHVFIASLLLFLFIANSEKPFFTFQAGYASYISKSIVLFIVFQKVLRYFYLKLLKKEPDFNIHSFKTANDFIYTTVLVFSSILLPIAIYLN